MKKLLLILTIFLFFIPHTDARMVIATTGGGGDTTPPTLSSATIGTDGVTWTFLLDETVSVGAGGNAGWAATMTTAGAISLTYASGSGSNTLVYTGTPVVLTADTVSSGLDYTQPGDGIEDTAGNDLASLTSFSVTNNSTQVPAESEEAISGHIVFSSSWTGSDVLNTGAGTGHVWSTETDTNNHVAQGTTTNNGFNGKQSYYLDVDNGALNLSATISNAFVYGSYSARFAFYVGTGFSADGNVIIFLVKNTTYSESLLYIVYRRLSGHHYLQGIVLNSLGAAVQIGSNIEISVGTWYQVRIKVQKNTVGDDAGAGASFEVYNEAGQVGTTQVLSSSYTTKNRDSQLIYAGALTAPGVAIVYRIDVLSLADDYTFPDLYTW